MATIAREARQVLAELAARPSLAVLCGGSEVAQQVAMLGLDPRLANGPLYGELLPSLVAEAEVQAPYVPSTPWGGDLPFRPDRGVANYYGVGAYLRPLEDARRSEVKLRRRVPGVRERARRGDGRGGSAVPWFTLPAGRRASRATPEPAGTSRTCATTTSACCTAWIRWDCAASTPSATWSSPAT